MKGRKKKYKRGVRVLIFLDDEVLKAFDSIITNRSSTINRLLKAYVNDKLNTEV